MKKKITQKTKYRMMIDKKHRDFSKHKPRLSRQALLHIPFQAFLQAVGEIASCYTVVAASTSTSQPTRYRVQEIVNCNPRN